MQMKGDELNGDLAAPFNSYNNTGEKMVHGKTQMIMVTI